MLVSDSSAACYPAAQSPQHHGYVVVGVILAPSVTGVVGEAAVRSFEPITETSLAVIAYLIGTSLNMGTLRSLGRSISWITLLQFLSGFAAVAAGLVLVAGRVMPGYTVMETYLPFGLLMGAIAAATAPPAILAIVRELRAKGPMTTTLLAVVALDDAVAVVLFALAAAYSGVLMGTSTAESTLEVVLQPVVELGGAVVVGVASLPACSSSPGTYVPRDVAGACARHGVAELQPLGGAGCPGSSPA